jgi:uncharacterized membrane protein
MQFLFSLSINKYNILMIFWNIFLAIIPCVTVYYMAFAVKNRKWDGFKVSEKVSFILLFIFWLLMLPNTAYLFTMVRHLVNYCWHYNIYRVCSEGTTWMVMLFFTYAILGLPTFYYALNKMSGILKKLFNPMSATVLPIVVIPLTAIGVMFGLFERFNSWDILVKPQGIIRTAFSYFTDLNLFINFLIFTISLYLIYYGMDYFIWKIIKK